MGEEIWYYPTAAKKFTRRDTTAESLTLKGTTCPDSDLLQSLTGETGALASGVLPSLELGDEKGLKSLCAIGGAEVSKIKPPRKPKPSKTEEVTPSTPKEHSGF